MAIMSVSSGDERSVSETQLPILRAIAKKKKKQLAPLIGFADKGLLDSFLEQVNTVFNRRKL